MERVAVQVADVMENPRVWKYYNIRPWFFEFAWWHEPQACC